MFTVRVYFAFITVSHYIVSGQYQAMVAKHFTVFHLQFIYLYTVKKSLWQNPVASASICLQYFAFSAVFPFTMSGYGCCTFTRGHSTIVKNLAVHAHNTNILLPIELHSLVVGMDHFHLQTWKATLVNMHYDHSMFMYCWWNKPLWWILLMACSLKWRQFDCSCWSDLAVRFELESVKCTFTCFAMCCI